MECVNGPQMGGDEGGGGGGGGDRVHASAGRASTLAAIRAGLEEICSGKQAFIMTKRVVEDILKLFLRARGDIRKELT